MLQVAKTKPNSLLWRLLTVDCRLSNDVQMTSVLRQPNWHLARHGRPRQVLSACLCCSALFSSFTNECGVAWHWMSVTLWEQNVDDDYRSSSSSNGSSKRLTACYATLSNCCSLVNVVHSFICDCLWSHGSGLFNCLLISHSMSVCLACLPASLSVRMFNRPFVWSFSRSVFVCSYIWAVIHSNDYWPRGRL